MNSPDLSFFGRNRDQIAERVDRAALLEERIGLLIYDMQLKAEKARGFGHPCANDYDMFVELLRGVIAQ